MAPVIYEFNNQSTDKSIEIGKNDAFDNSKHTKTYTLDEAIEETSAYTTTLLYKYTSHVRAVDDSLTKLKRC